MPSVPSFILVFSGVSGHVARVALNRYCPLSCALLYRLGVDDDLIFIVEFAGEEVCCLDAAIGEKCVITRVFATLVKARGICLWLNQP